jgi:hypothetical protein
MSTSLSILALGFAVAAYALARHNAARLAVQDRRQRNLARDLTTLETEVGLLEHRGRVHDHRIDVIDRAQRSGLRVVAVPTRTTHH